MTVASEQEHFIHYYNVIFGNQDQTFQSGEDINSISITCVRVLMRDLLNYVSCFLIVFVMFFITGLKGNWYKFWHNQRSPSQNWFYQFSYKSIESQIY